MPTTQVPQARDMKVTSTSEPFISTPNDAPAYWLLDILWVVHATGDSTQGRYSMIEQWMPDDAFAPPHVHSQADESFWVIEGELTVQVGDKTLVLGPSSMGHVPRNHVHSFKVTGKSMCHMLNYYTPVGFEQVIIGSARPAARSDTMSISGFAAIRVVIERQSFPTASDSLLAITYNTFLRSARGLIAQT